jgi:hypothetical protein
LDEAQRAELEQQRDEMEHEIPDIQDTEPVELQEMVADDDDEGPATDDDSGGSSSSSGDDDDDEANDENFAVVESPDTLGMIRGVVLDGIKSRRKGTKLVVGGSDVDVDG